MQSFTHLLRLMTKNYNLITLLVNTAVRTTASNPQSAFIATNVKPALGVSWTFTADTCLLMHRSVDEHTVIVEVIRSRSGVNPTMNMLAYFRKVDGSVSIQQR